MDRQNQGTIITHQPPAKTLIRRFNSNQGRPTSQPQKPNLFTQSAEYQEYFEEQSFKKNRAEINKRLFGNRP